MVFFFFYLLDISNAEIEELPKNTMIIPSEFINTIDKSIKTSLIQYIPYHIEIYKNKKAFESDKAENLVRIKVTFCDLNHSRSLNSSDIIIKKEFVSEINFNFYSMYYELKNEIIIIRLMRFELFEELTNAKIDINSYRAVVFSNVTFNMNNLNSEQKKLIDTIKYKTREENIFLFTKLDVENTKILDNYKVFINKRNRTEVYREK